MNTQVDMDTKDLRYHFTYLKMALEWSKLSHCKRRQVGCILVKNNMIISDGYNGSPAGFDNNCEDCDGLTHWYVLHAEENAILKCAKNGISSNDSILYITHSPCQICSKLILSSGIKEVFYAEEYKDLSGVEFLVKNNIKVTKLKID